MNTEFVIVIEADNKRAAAAYRKGLDDLERIWPQIVDFCDKADAEAKRRREEEEAREQQELDQYKRAIAAHDEWQSKSPLWRGEEPPRPWLPYRYIGYRDILWSHRERFDSIKRDLEHMLNVAEAALGPFRMTEHEVDRMVEWETGRRIDCIKQEINA